MKKLRRRLGLDLILTIMLCMEMFYEITGDTLHELIGIAMFATICIHLILSRKWMKTTTKKIRSGSKLKSTHKTSLVVNSALGIMFVALVASSIAISQLLSLATGIWTIGNTRSIWVIIHTVSSYGMCALVVVHLLLHWSSIAAAFKIPYDPARRQAISTGAGALAAVSVIALGLASADTLAAQLAPTIPTADAKAATDIPDTGKQVNSADSTAQAATKTPSAEESASPVAETTTQPAPAEAAKPAPTGFCPLCKKHCPLSDPACDRPYEAGLI